MNVTVPYTRIRAHNTTIQSVTMQSNMYSDQSDKTIIPFRAHRQTALLLAHSSQNHYLIHSKFKL